MIIEQAIVTGRQGDRIEVRLLRGSACGHCELRPGCGMGAIGRLLGRRSRPLYFTSERRLAPGDRVRLGLSEGALLRGSLAVYGLPLLGMLSAGLVAAVLGFADAGLAIASLIGFALGLAAARRRVRRLEEDGLTPHIVDIQVNPGTEQGS